MRTLAFVACFILSFFFAYPATSTVVLSEGFENGGSIPAGWSQEYVTGTLNWDYRDGGGGFGFPRHPTSAHSGDYNAFFYVDNDRCMKTKLMTPPIDFAENTNSAALTFWLCMEKWLNDQDELRVYYKTSAGGAWTLLQEYTNTVDDWTQKTIPLPEPGKTYYIAFEGYEDYGYGVCVDDVEVTGINPYPHISLMPAAQADEAFPGSAVAYPLTIENGTKTNTDFDMSYSSAPWPETGPTNTGVIVDGGTTTITVNVDVPGAAFDGQASTTIVTVVSVGDNSLTGTAVIVTRCTWRGYALRETFDSGLPAGWSNYMLGGSTSAWEWQDWGGNPTGGCLVHSFIAAACTNWYVSPALDLSYYSECLLKFDEQQTRNDRYNYAGVWISTGNRDPAVGDYTQLLEIGEAPLNWWYYTKEADMTAYAGASNLYLAFLYIGNDNHKQYIDNLFLSGLKIGIDNATLVSPATITMNSYENTPSITGALFISGETGVSGPAANVTAEVGCGLRNSSPTSAWNWTTASYTGSDGTNDIFSADAFVTVSGEQDYAYRFRRGEATWVYADLDGSTNGYSIAAAGKMSISNCPVEGKLLVDQTIPPEMIGGYVSCYQVPSNAPPFYQELSDDFLFDYDTTLKSVQWGGAYFVDGRQGLEHGFWLRIYDNAPTGTTNLPGNLLYSELKQGYACEQLFAYDAAHDLNLYTYDVTLATPFSASAGSTYWFSVQDVVTSDTYWSWLDTSDAVQGNPFTWTADNIFGTNDVVWHAHDCDLGFKLYGEKFGNIFLDPGEQSSEGHPGDTVPYMLTLENRTGGSDTFGLSYDSLWNVNGPASSGVIVDGGDTTIVVNVEIPGAVPDGQVVTSTVTAVGIGNPAFTNTAIVITIASYDHRLYCENFDGSWPPAGWTSYQTGDANPGWTNAYPGADGTGQCAFHNDDAFHCDDWLVTPPINLDTTGFDSVRLSFQNKIRFPTYYVTSVVMISTGSMNPSDGDYVPLLDVGNDDTDWTERDIDLAAYAGSNPVYFAFRYIGDFDHEWSVDDVCVLGRMDVPSGVLRGQITAAHSGQPLPYARVMIDGEFCQWSLWADLDGNYMQPLPTNVYVVSAAAEHYATGTVTDVAIAAGVTNVQDIALDGSLLTYGPPAIEETLAIGAMATNTVYLTNSGPLEVDYWFGIKNNEGPKLKNRGGFHSVLAYAFDINISDPNNLMAFYTGSPYMLYMVGPTTISSPAYISGADFMNGDFGVLYALAQETNYLVAISTTNGGTTYIGPAVPGADEYWTGMSGDPDGTLYACGADEYSNSFLYTIDPDSGAPTSVGVIGSPMMIVDIAINAQGEMYGLDILNDVLVRINKATGAGTDVGPIGFNANFPQSMDFDEVSGTLYLAAFNGLYNKAELRVADTTTGSTTNLGFIGDGTIEFDGFAIATYSGPPWLNVSTNAGTILPGEATSFDVMFDAGAVADIGTYTADIEFSGTFVNDVPDLPLTMHVVASPTPVIQVSTNLLAFAQTVVYETNQETLIVANIGGAILTGEVQDVAAPFSVASGGSYMLASLSSQSVSFVFAPVSEGDYTNVVTLTGGGGATVTLVGTAVPEPIMPVIVYVLACLAAGRKRATGAA